MILDEVLNYIPKTAKVSDSGFEGANIVLYTKNKEFFLNNEGLIREIVNKIKKRIELRADPAIIMEQEKAKKAIQKIIPKEASADNILFDPQRSRVIIEAEKPGLAIGKQGEVLKEIKAKTLWTPTIKRTPSIRSKLIENIRHVLYENNDYRKKFLNKIGQRIYEGPRKDKKSDWVRISFLGGARQVGKSSLLLQTPESKVLLDCGINVAVPDKYAFPFLDAPEFNIQDLDAVVLSHAHLDHCALIPFLYKMGYKGPVYCTKPTRDVAALLCLDYIGIAQKELKTTPYDSSHVKDMVKHTVCLDYEEVTDITPDVRLTLYNAGHNLGSSMCHMHIGNGLHNLLYTGDMNYENSNLLAAAVTKFPRLETVITEATYGGKDDKVPARKTSEEEVIKIVKETFDKKGKVLMPVLGVGRSQEVMLILEKAMREGKIPKAPIYLQGMVWDVTAIHTAYPDFFNPKVRRAIFHKDQNPFLSDVFKHVAGAKEMKEVKNHKGSCIIMATSGMMVGGPSVEYFKELAESDKHNLILTCYQGEGSLGRRLQNGEKEIVFQEGSKQELIKVKMGVNTIKGFSGHSSRDQLINFFYRLNPQPKKILIVHGESSKCLDLASSLHKIMKVETIAPKNMESIRIR